MTLRASLIRQLENHALPPNQRAEIRCQLAKELEDVGDYESAREAISEFWQRVGEKPQLDGLDRHVSAEVLLRAGTLTGWLGNCNQIEAAQESAKNLISESLTIFDSLSYAKKVLEAQTELAYCYWREGAFDEARLILKGVLERLTTDSELRAKAVLRSAIVERGATRFSDALRILTEYAPLFDKIQNHTIKGGYHNELAIVLRNLGTSEKREDYLDRAFVEYTAASVHFEQAGHMPYCALVENNLGFLYFKAGRFQESHEHLQRARRLFSSLKDKGTAAQVDDTRARVLLAQGRNEEAEQVARAAVRALEKGGRQSLLAEAMTTHGTALARLGQHDYARLTLFRAIEVAHLSGAINDAGLAALTVIEELSEHLKPEELQSIYRRAYYWLVTSQHLQTLQRLLHASSRVLGTESNPQQGGSEAVIEARWTLREVMQRHEGRLIKQALQRAEGSVTQAARLLGLTHQALAYMLKHRHKDLLTERIPARRRKRGIFKRKD